MRLNLIPRVIKQRSSLPAVFFKFDKRNIPQDVHISVVSTTMILSSRLLSNFQQFPILLCHLQKRCIIKKTYIKRRCGTLLKTAAEVGCH